MNHDVNIADFVVHLHPDASHDEGRPLNSNCARLTVLCLCTSITKSNHMRCSWRTTRMR